jgi:hypothetical protein
MSTTDFFLTIGSRSKAITTGGGHAKPKAGLRAVTSGNKLRGVVDNDSTELSEFNSGSDGDGKGDGSDEESDGGMAQVSDDDFDRAKLTEKDAKQVLNDEVIFLFIYFFLLSCPL